MVFHDCFEGGPLLGGIGDVARDAVHDRAAVVHRVVEDRTGIDDPVEMGDGQADRGTVDRGEIASAGRAVQIDRVSMRPYPVGRTTGAPSWMSPKWQIRPASNT